MFVIVYVLVCILCIDRYPQTEKITATEAQLAAEKASGEEAQAAAKQKTTELEERVVCGLLHVNYCLHIHIHTYIHTYSSIVQK